MTVKRLIAAVALACGLIVGSAPAASAHPLGNFTINVYAGLRVQPDAILVDYVVDHAEIPTFQAGPDLRRAGSQAWATERCATLARGLDLRLDGARVALAPARATRCRPPALAGSMCCG